MSAQVAADLRAAAEYIAEHGWTQGEYESADGACCIAGALAHVAAHYVGSKWTFQEIVGESTVHYNDAPGRTADEVIAALRAAADRAEAQQ